MLFCSRKTAPVRYTYYSMCVHMNATTYTVMNCKVNSNQLRIFVIMIYVFGTDCYLNFIICICII